jgi:hypothetical protein
MTRARPAASALDDDPAAVTGAVAEIVPDPPEPTR